MSTINKPDSPTPESGGTGDPVRIELDADTIQALAVGQAGQGKVPVPVPALEELRKAQDPRYRLWEAEAKTAHDDAEDADAGPVRRGGAGLVRLVVAVVFLALAVLAVLPALTSGYLLTAESLTALGIASSAVVYAAGRWLGGGRS